MFIFYKTRKNEKIVFVHVKNTYICVYEHGNVEMYVFMSKRIATFGEVLWYW
jgi:hypothetical protein